MAWKGIERETGCKIKDNGQLAKLIEAYMAYYKFTVIIDNDVSCTDQMGIYAERV